MPCRDRRAGSQHQRTMRAQPQADPLHRIDRGAGGTAMPVCEVTATEEPVLIQLATPEGCLLIWSVPRRTGWVGQSESTAGVVGGDSAAVRGSRNALWGMRRRR